jgi:hypothetical protein
MGEMVRMNTITEKHFLESYRQICRKFFDEYKTQDDPEDPIHLFWTRNLEHDLVDKMQEEYRSIGKDACRMRTQPDRDLFWEMEKVASSFRAEMREWFAIAGYDETGIPPAPDIDHTKRKMKPAERQEWQGKIGANWFRGSDTKTAWQIGQLVYTGSSSVSKGWAELYVLSGLRICHFHPETSGVYVWNQELTEAAWGVAEKLSRLTDWSQFTEELPMKVRRAIAKNMREIIDETELREYSRLG